jgi:hypothetical protein
MFNLTAKNPLGIIALFISLIYGTCALLLGAAVDKVSDQNQNILTIFIVGFPVAVLVAFIFLVTKHHKKLYGPGDFRSDEGFLTSAEPRNIGRKYIEEASDRAVDDQVPSSSSILPAAEDSETASTARGSESAGQDSAIADQKTSMPSVAPEQAKVLNSSSSLPRSPSYYYMVEGLVMQEMQSLYGAAIRREVAVHGPNGEVLRFDGLIETPNTATIVEIKYVHAGRPWQRPTRNGLAAISTYLRAFRARTNKKTNGLLIIVHDADVSARMMDQATMYVQQQHGADVEVKFFNVEMLMRKYGLSPEREAL